MYVDIHNHCLPNMDDGSRSMEESLDMLREYQKNRIYEIIVTPHYHYQRGQASVSCIQDGVRRLKESAKQAGIRIQIHAGNEIYYSHDVPELLGRGEILTLAGSRYVLVEFSPTENIATVRDGLYEVMSAGYYPVLAHAERILAVAEDLRCLESLVEMGVYIQMNVKSVKSEAGFRMRRFVKEAILHDMIHFLATDAHRRDIRTPDISEDVRYIRRKFGAGFLYRTMCENPGKIIRDEVI